VLDQDGPTIEIRPATETDFDAIWQIFHAVVAAGDTYAFPPDSTADDARRVWLGAGILTFVASRDSRIVGTYILEPNQPGLGGHVANAGFMTVSLPSRRSVWDTSGQGVIEFEHTAAPLAARNPLPGRPLQPVRPRSVLTGTHHEAFGIRL